jgi:hypothetical protein
MLFSASLFDVQIVGGFGVERRRDKTALLP